MLYLDFDSYFAENKPAPITAKGVAGFAT